MPICVVQGTVSAVVTIEYAQSEKDRGQECHTPTPDHWSTTLQLPKTRGGQHLVRVLTGSGDSVVDSLHIMDILNVLLYEFPSVDDAFL